MSLSSEKAQARKAAFSRRKLAHEQGQDAFGNARLLEFLTPHRGRVLAGYMSIRSEIDPLPTMIAMARFGRVCTPVIQAKGQALKFREWSPGCPLVAGPFGAKIPASGDWLIPEVLVVPLVAFDRFGGRLGYGGGFYDRTLQGLREVAPTIAIGFAYAAQEAQYLPIESTDQPLDFLITEREILTYS